MNLQSNILAKITHNRVKNLTVSELREIFKLITDEESRLIVQAIKSTNAERIQAAIEIPVYRVMQSKVQELNK